MYVREREKKGIIAVSKTNSCKKKCSRLEGDKECKGQKRIEKSFQKILEEKNNN